MPVEISVESESLLGFLSWLIRPTLLTCWSSAQRVSNIGVHQVTSADDVFDMIGFSPRIASHKKDDVGWRMRELSCSFSDD